MDVIIIGGGVAGLSCALYTSKAGMETVIIDQQTSQLGSVKAVLNFPGFAQGVAGEDWLLAAREQVTTAGATLTLGKATELKTTNRPYTVITEDGRSFTAPYVVLAVNLGFELLTKHDYALLVNEHVPSRKIRHIEGIGYDGKTAQPGIFAAGLIANVPSQSVIAAGQGAFVGVQIASDFLQKPFMWHD